jgi:thioredoxin-related protein
MKTLIILLSLVYTLFAISAVDAAFVLGFHEEYPTALAQAKQEKKPLLLVIIKDPCPYSERMVHSTLSDPKVMQSLKDIVPVIVDKEVLLPAQFTTDLFPTTFFIDPKKETEILKRVGYLSSEQFLDDLKVVHTLYKEK